MPARLPRRRVSRGCATGWRGPAARFSGASVLVLPGGEIMQSLRSGAIHGAEWVGPWLDTALGLHTAMPYYYYPGVQEPGSAISVGINKGVWESFDAGDQRLIQAAAASEFARSLAEFNTNNALALQRLQNEGAVKILKLDDSILKAYREISKDVVGEMGSGNELSRKIYASYQQFLGLIKGWSDIAEGAVLLSRRIA